MSRRRVGVLGRTLDAASLLLIVAGALLFQRSYAGFAELRLRAAQSTFVPGTTEAFELLQEFTRLQRLSNTAVALAALGISAGVVAWVQHRRRRGGSAHAHRG